MHPLSKEPLHGIAPGSGLREGIRARGGLGLANCPHGTGVARVRSCGDRDQDMAWLCQRPCPLLHSSFPVMHTDRRGDAGRRAGARLREAARDLVVAVAWLVIALYGLFLFATAGGDHSGRYPGPHDDVRARRSATKRLSGSDSLPAQGPLRRCSVPVRPPMTGRPRTATSARSASGCRARCP